MVDIQVFGETGLIAARRGPGGRAGVVPFGPVAVPRGSKGGVIVGEVRATANGTVAMRGPMVPRFAFPPGVERHGPAPAQGGAHRLCRYRLRLLERPGQRAPGGHRAAARHGQHRRLSLPDARPAGRHCRGRRDRHPGGAARCDDRPSAGRLRRRSWPRSGRRWPSRGANPLLVNAFRERQPATAADNGTAAA